MFTAKGCPTPRIEWQPEAATNEADRVIRFYHHWGRRLDVWQQNALRIGLGFKADGTPAAFEVGIIVSRQNGKGYVAEALCLYALFILGLPVTIYSAHKGDTVEKALESMRSLIRNNEELARRCKPINDSDTTIETLGGAKLAFKTRGVKSGGRGLTGDLLIVDEALELKQQTLNALMPIMMTKPFAQIWYTSTVPESDDQFLCTVRERALNHSEGVAWAEWSADPTKPLDAVENIAQANPGLGKRIGINRVFQLLGILGEDGWKTECMGIWPGKAGGAALDRDALERMRDPDSRRGENETMVFSLDATPLLDWGTIGMWALRDDGLEHMQVVDSRAGIDWMVSRAAQLNEVCRPMAWAIDGANGAMILADQLADVGITRPVVLEEDPRTGRVKEIAQPPTWGQLYVLDAADAALATQEFLDAWRRERLRWPGDARDDGGRQEPLRRAALNVRTRLIGDRGGIGWGRKTSSVNIGPIVTVTQCRRAWQAWHDVISTDYNVVDSLPLADGQCPDCNAWAPDGMPIEHYDDCQLVRMGVAA